MTLPIDKMIQDVIKVEGGYCNDPHDAGGETNYGITIATARANGYTGSMKDLPLSVAAIIYKKQYYYAPKLDKVEQISEAVAAELFDTGVNMGVGTAGKFLQRALNALNNQQKLYSDLVVDGGIGDKTIAALAAWIKAKGVSGEKVLVNALNCLQGARYIEIAEKNPTQETFVYGWLLQRVGIK